MGNPEEFTILDLAEKTIEITKSEAGYILNELPIDDPQRRCPDISLAKKSLGWKPTTELNHDYYQRLIGLEGKLNVWKNLN